MNCEELLQISNDRNVDILLHLPEYEGMKLIMVGGAICTQEMYDNFTESFCHLVNDGQIWRYHRVIGSFSDIEVLNIIDAAEHRVQLTGGQAGENNGLVALPTSN